MKLKEDFGVTALFGCLIIVGAFAVILAALLKDKIEFESVFVAVSSWVGSIITAYVLKAKTNGFGGKEQK
jgi:hypothetical protein